MKALLRRAMPVLCLCAGTLLAEPPSAFHQVKAWEGRLKVAGTASDSLTTLAGQETWTMTYDADVRLVFDEYIPLVRTWKGRVEGPGLVKGSYTNSMPHCTRIERIEAGGATQASDPRSIPALLQVAYDGTYRLEVNWTDVPGKFHTRLQCTAGTTERTDESLYNWWVWDFPGQFALPGSGLRLSGAGTYSAWLAFDTQGYALQGRDKPDVPVKVEWEIWPAGTRPELEVVVTVDGYEQWRPEAAKGGGLGNRIGLTAKLRRADGSAADEEALRFEWSFAQVSRTPGHAMNYPVRDPETDPDLRFQAGAGLVVVEDGLKANTTAGLRRESAVQVGSYDWGGFGEVRVAAVLLDGRRIEGRLEGAPGPGVLLPKRQPGDLIAEIWRKQRGVSGLADSSDGEDEPVGDGNSGDGLTLYEEYRGFIEAGEHIEGDPKRKDYFVTNLAGGGYLPGILMFQHLTGLAVHHRFAASEWPDSRTVNANHSATPHLVDQHGVLIFFKDAGAGYAEAAGGPGTPGMIRGIFVPAMTGATKPEFARYLNLAMAHELLHACNVYHHGDAGEETVRWRRAPGTDRVLEEQRGVEREVEVLSESGMRLNPVFPEAAVEVLLGAKDGPHTGPEQCVMRYDIAGGYRSARDGATRYRVKEGLGFSLCSQTHGDGVNDASRTPQARYGDSAAGRGDCAHQILVNDAVKAAAR